MLATKTTYYGGDVVMFLPNKTIKNKNSITGQKMSVRKTTQYGGDDVMFLLNKIIKNKN